MDGIDPALPTQGGEFYPGEAAHADAGARMAHDGRLAELRTLKFKRRLLAVVLVVCDALACLAGVFISQTVYHGAVDLGVAATVLAGGFPVYFLAALQTGAHNPAVAFGPGASIKRATLAFAVTAAIFFIGVFAAKISGSVSRLQVGQTIVYTFLLGAAGRYVIAKRAMRSMGSHPYAVLCIYDDVPFSPSRGKGAIRAADVGLDLDLSCPDAVRRLGELARGMDRIVVHCSPERRDSWGRMLRCVDRRSEIVMPELTPLIPLAIRYRGGEVSLVLANGPLRWHERATKILFDRTVSAVAVVMLAPLMLLIALAVKLESPGPVFFRQHRIGLGNRHFRIWKFRTMRAERTDHHGHTSATRDDDRVTRVGRLLRRTSLDELPQLFNVVIGQMSIVGPRPHAAGSRAEELLFWDIDERYWHRHSIKPGITGLAQIRGLRGATHRREDLEQRLHADLEYAAEWSLMLDIRIIIQTFGVMLHRNAY